MIRRVKIRSRSWCKEVEDKTIQPMQINCQRISKVVSRMTGIDSVSGENFVSEESGVSWRGRREEEEGGSKM